MYLNLFIIITIFISHIFNSSSSAFSYSQEKKDKEFVYLLHGLGRSKTAMWLLASRLEDAGFIVQPIDYSSLSNSQHNLNLENMQSLLLVIHL